MALTEYVDITASLALLDDLRIRLVALQGSEADHNHQGGDRTTRAVRAETSRQLLYVAHLAKVVETELLSTYHRFKGGVTPCYLAGATAGVEGGCWLLPATAAPRRAHFSEQ